MTLRRMAIASVTGFLLPIIAVAIYATHVYASARRLTGLAVEIHSTEDAKRLISASQSRPETNQFGEQSYDFRVDNSWLYHLRIAPPTVVGMTVVIRNNELRTVLLVMYTGWEPNSTLGAWIQEWFGPDIPKSLHVERNNEHRVTIDFPSLISDSERKKLFGVNAYCLIKPGGCTKTEEILPDLSDNLG
jgi:hypothetical protein